MKSRKKNKEPDSKQEEQPFFGKQRDDDTFFQRKESEKEKDEDKEKEVQAKAEGNAISGNTHSTAKRASHSAGKGEPLSGSAKLPMESAFQSSFDDVKIHTDDEASEMSEDLQAQAFTFGQDIYFKKGKYKPGTIEGDGLLAHELAHTLQQKDSTTTDANFNAGAELEADEAAIDFIQNRGIKNLNNDDKQRPVRKPKGNKKLSLQRCQDKSDKAPGPTPVPPVKDAGPPADPNAAMRTQVANVKSLRLEEYRGRLATEIEDLKKRFTKRNSHLNEKLPLVKGAQKTTVQEMIDRGNAWAGSNMDAWSNNDIDEAIKKERADLNKLDKNANTSDVINKFIQALEQLKNRKTQISEEEVEYKRFDVQYMDPQVIEICQKIPNTTITPADIKSLISQETGDMTNTAVAGITGKKKGILTSRENKNFVGLGQQSEDARDEAISWAQTQKSTIAVDPKTDPRSDPGTAIKLTAAYLGRLSDLLWSGLPQNKPGPVEFKRMLFAAYNGGAQTIINAAKDFTKGIAKAYTWDQIKNLLKWNGKKTDPKTTEIRNYVVDIEKRTAPGP